MDPTPPLPPFVLERNNMFNLIRFIVATIISLFTIVRKLSSLQQQIATLTKNINDLTVENADLQFKLKKHENYSKNRRRSLNNKLRALDIKINNPDTKIEYKTIRHCKFTGDVTTKINKSTFGETQLFICALAKDECVESNDASVAWIGLEAPYGSNTYMSPEEGMRPSDLRK